MIVNNAVRRGKTRSACWFVFRSSCFFFSFHFISFSFLFISLAQSKITPTPAKKTHVDITHHALSTANTLAPSAVFRKAAKSFGGAAARAASTYGCGGGCKPHGCQREKKQQGNTTTTTITTKKQIKT